MRKRRRPVLLATVSSRQIDTEREKRREHTTTTTTIRPTPNLWVFEIFICFSYFVSINESFPRRHNMGNRESRSRRPPTYLRPLSSQLLYQPVLPIPEATPTMTPTLTTTTTTTSSVATGGYDVTFVQQPLEERFKCPVCLLALRDPVQTSCGHRLCSTCCERLKK